jgi:hypothetical protein
MSSTSRPRGRTTLDAGAYTDPAWFDAEGDRIFARMWLAVGREAEPMMTITIWPQTPGRTKLIDQRRSRELLTSWSPFYFFEIQPA